MASEGNGGNVVFEWGKRKLGAAGHPATLLAFGLIVAVLAVVISRETQRNFWGTQHQAAHETNMAMLASLKAGQKERTHEHDRLADALVRIADALQRLTTSVERTATLQALTVQFLQCQAHLAVIMDDPARSEFFRTSPMCQPLLRRGSEGLE